VTQYQHLLGEAKAAPKDVSARLTVAMDVLDRCRSPQHARYGVPEAAILHADAAFKRDTVSNVCPATVPRKTSAFRIEDMMEPKA
jgi:hypothetical protein